VNPGVIRGGTRTNVIAESAEVECDVRIARAKDTKLIEKKFLSLKPFNKKCKLNIEGGMNRPPMERTPGVAKLYKLAAQIAKEQGYKLREHATGGGSDGNFTSGLGIPTLDGLGCPGEGAHALHESILVDELERRVRLIAGLIERI
jgi:glutamate carboxypeptidase